MIIGIVIALVAAGLVIVTGGGKQSSDNGARSQDVVVAAVDIPVGSQVSDSLVKVVKFAPDQVPVGTVTTTKAAVGQFAAVALPKNMLLTNTNLVASTKQLPAQKKPYLDIPAGFVAIAVPMGGELQAVGGWIQQDDKVDILFNPSGTTKPIWKTTYQNVRVAHLGGPAAAGGAAATASSMILYVTLDDAENLAQLFASGNYKLALKSQADAAKNDILPSAGATNDSLLAKFNIPK